MVRVRVRDAHDGDVDSIAALTTVETGVAERLVRERRVAVAERAGGGDGTSGDGETEDDESDAIVGVVAYDVADAAVHVTRLAGETEAVAVLLDEPIGFARAEDMSVEALVPDSAAGALDAVTDAGFKAVGEGPRFAGDRTTRYRLTVDENA
ncbi:hypothetical protein MBEHAL_1346 [Halarchaeum acidiphilum MH1-52-1]|uniref:N-acetyltransferase domain-containing protein n=1 Tax=Halarchaeum acidiphilum MH1-52-1 TaxID=1261545 RepID=U2YF52_9EURY|nr:hypothetical protein [Halarchaeum acidiphilum]GAD52586.1 hypothetical protein MBEHAL_1346 [Halarchaeum acidiphilum MH1-52-1]